MPASCVSRTRRLSSVTTWSLKKCAACVRSMEVRHTGPTRNLRAGGSRARAPAAAHCAHGRRSIQAPSGSPSRARHAGPSSLGPESVTVKPHSVVLPHAAQAAFLPRAGCTCMKGRVASCVRSRSLHCATRCVAAIVVSARSPRNMVAAMSSDTSASSDRQRYGSSTSVAKHANT